jgi:hypothetical protein
MRLSRVLTSAAVATSLVSAPVVAQAAMAERSVATIEGESLNGDNTGFIIPVVVLVAIIFAVLAFDDDDDDLPNSP